MSKGGGGSSVPPKDKEAQGTIKTGFQPYPMNGQFPILPSANYWEGGNFKMPGVAAPLMSSDLLSRFPQLAGLFGGRDPEQGSNTAVQPGMYGLPPSFGTNPPPEKPEKPKNKRWTRPTPLLDFFEARQEMKNNA